MTLKLPREGARREMVCPTCDEPTLSIAVFLAVDEHRREFSGWRCTECGTEHSGE